MRGILLYCIAYMSNQIEVRTYTGSFTVLGHNLAKIQERATSYGVDFRYDVWDGEHASHERDIPMFAASLGKLPLALAVSTEPGIHRNDEVVIRSSDLRNGRGAYDLTEMRQHGINGIFTTTVEEAVRDMLGRSGNTAYRVLARELADRHGMGESVGELLNERYFALGFPRTNVMPRVASAEIGLTTPEEVMKQFSAIEDAAAEQGSQSLAATAWHALSIDNSRGNGLRRFVLPDGYDLLSKSAEYNGDENDPHVYRHEAGNLILGDDRVIKYCFMTQSRSRHPVHRLTTEMALARATNEVAKYANFELPRLLGLRALVG